MFQRFQEMNTPKPLDRYAGTYEGKTKTATIQEGQDLMGVFLANKGSRMIKSVQLLAQESRGGKEYTISVEDMLTNRFPKDKPIDLYLEVEQGPAVQKEDGEDRNPELNPAETKGQVMFNVYEQAQIYTKQGEKAMIQRMMDELDISMRNAVATHTQAPPPVAE